MTKKIENRPGLVKIGRKGPESFGTSQQKYFTPFHNKIMFHSSILKKKSPTKKGVIISGQRGTLLQIRKNSLFSQKTFVDYNYGNVAIGKFLISRKVSKFHLDAKILLHH